MEEIIRKRWDKVEINAIGEKVRLQRHGELFKQILIKQIRKGMIIWKLRMRIRIRNKLTEDIQLSIKVMIVKINDIHKRSSWGEIYQEKTGSKRGN